MNKAVTAIVTGLIVAVVVGGAAFYAGMRFQQFQRTRAFAQGMQGGFGGPGGPGGPGGFGGFGGGGGMRGGGRQGGGFAAGQILSADSKSITVKMPDGGSKTVYISSAARITKSTEATASDLTVGANVIVGGTAGTDGGITARTIQIVPAGMVQQRMGGGQPGQPGAPGAPGQ